MNFTVIKKNLEKVIGEHKNQFIGNGGSLKEWEDFSKMARDLIYGCCRLHAYMNFRAQLEFPDKEQPHEFDEEWYFQQMLGGCFTFFGINCCPCHGEIVEDTQNPKAYEKFCELEKTDPERAGRIRMETLH
jgi:hypothetical protein|tara:strand:- start:39 stop:431 length:393 start_codon:yes stop_codon:yes gene_type:complete